jgi:hypothetical protein
MSSMLQWANTARKALYGARYSRGAALWRLLQIAGISLTLSGCAMPDAGVSYASRATRVSSGAQPIGGWAPSIFVANGASYVDQFTVRKGRERRVIEDGAQDAYGLAVDRRENLWVASFAQNSVTEYAPNTDVPERRLDETAHAEWPIGIAICNRNVYVSNQYSSEFKVGSVLVFDYGTLQQVATLVAPDLEYGYYAHCDRHGNVFLDYVDTSGAYKFVEFRRGHNAYPKSVPITLQYPVDFQIMRSGDLVVPNLTTVDFYHPGERAPYRSISGFSSATAVSLSRREDRMWVLDRGTTLIDEVDVQNGDTLQTIGAGKLDFPEDVLAVPTNLP